MEHKTNLLTNFRKALHLNDNDEQDARPALKKKAKKGGGKEAGATLKKEPKASSSNASPTKSVIPQQNAAITKKEVKTVLEELGPVTILQIVKYFMPRLNSAEEKKNFTVILTKIAHIRRRESGVAYVFLN